MDSYRKLCARFYDIDKPEPPANALEFYLRYCSRSEGAVLEPMCGSGRFLVPLMERGIDIDGVDASSSMLEACRQRCREKGFSPNLFEQAVEHMNLPRQYSLVIVPASSFCLLTVPKQIQDGLRCIRLAMLPGATLVLEIELHRQRGSQTWPWSGRRVDLPDGGQIKLRSLTTYSSDDHVMRSVNRYELIEDGKVCETEREEFNIRHYDCAEFQSLLEDAGFCEIRCLKPYSGEPAGDSEECAVFECRKVPGT